MASDPLLELNLVDVYGKPLNEKVDIILRHQVLSETVKFNRLINGQLQISGLRGAPQGRYRIEVDPPSYQYVSQFLNIGASGVTPREIKFPVDAGKIISVKFPAYNKLSAELRTLLEKSKSVKGFEGLSGKKLYEALDSLDPRKAGLLNIAAKTENTYFANGKNVLTAIIELVELRGDRFFAIVPQELREDTKNSIANKLFREVNGMLHHPPNGYDHAGSFKTKDRYGNLQLTFFAGTEDWKADIDIDDASGIEHIFQVIRNELPGQDTNPYNIHEILVGYQHIDPGYSFIV